MLPTQAMTSLNFLKAEWLSIIFRVREKNKGPILQTTVYSARNVGARGFFLRERTSEPGYLVRVYLKHEVPVNVINNPSGKITQVFRKLEKLNMFSSGLSCFEFSCFWNVIRKCFSLFTKIIATLLRRK